MSVFNPFKDIDDTLDKIEKHYSLSGSALDKNAMRISTGVLSIDLVLGGGLVGGAWYTMFGPEQTGKSTLSSTIMTAALNTSVPILSYWDYEGCLTGDTLIVVNDRQTRLGSMFDRDMKKDVPLNVSHLDWNVKTVAGNIRITSILYRGPKDITLIALDNGDSLTGFRHPVLVCNEEHCLEWKYIEDLCVGDFVVCVNA